MQGRAGAAAVGWLPAHPSGGGGRRYFTSSPTILSVMKSVIVGTPAHRPRENRAGKGLTGIDAVSLEEEKRRGITIDIALRILELALPGGEILRLGLSSSRTRTVRAQYAGRSGGIDLVLLVIAADESVKPQTASISISAACLRCARASRY